MAAGPAGAVTPHTAARLAWGQLVLAAVLAAATLLLVGLAEPVEPTQPAAWSRALMPLVLLEFSVVGLLVVARLARNPIGWILCWVGLDGLIGQCATQLANLGLSHRPEPLAGSEAMAWLASWNPPSVVLPLITFGFLLFPDGRLPSPGWRPLAWVAVAGTVVLTVVYAVVPGPMSSMFPSVSNPFAIEAVSRGAFGIVAEVAFVAVLGCVLGSAASMLVRLRRVQGVQRRQLGWVIYAASVLGISTVASGLLDWLANVHSGALQPLALAGLPVAFAVAIFRYRLFGIDVVVSRTFVFGALAGLIGVAYVAVVVGLGSLIGQREHSGPALSLLATALVAFVFQPVREWTQRLANRLVYGARAAPYEVLSAFSRRMTEPFATHELLPQMATLLAEGTGATEASVWLVIDNELQRAACWPPRPATTTYPLLAHGELPTIPRATRTVAVHNQGQLLGAFTLTRPSSEPLTPAEDRLLGNIAAQVSLGLRNIRLIEELKASRLRIVAAQDAERRRLERDIHDGAQQRLVSLSWALGMARSQPGRSAALARGLRTATTQLTLAAAELRQLARGVHPAILTDEGLGPALESIAERSAIAATLDSTPTERLPAHVEVAAYAVAAQALADAAREGASAANVSAWYESGRLVVEVVDNAVGAAGSSRRPGVLGLLDTVAALNGQLHVDSRAHMGTVVRAIIPCDPANAVDHLQ